MAHQTCRRHPNAAPFNTSCPGCAQELYDMEARNRAHSDATAALALIGTTGVDIVTATRNGDTLTVATHQPDSLTCTYAVDVFRLPTPAETDPDLADAYRLTPGQWILIWQAGDDTQDSVSGMLSAAHTYLIDRGLIPDWTPAPQTDTPADTVLPVVRLPHLPTMPVLPATQADADRQATTASDAFWDHACDCEVCWAVTAEEKPGSRCNAGARLYRTAADMSDVAGDFAGLNGWYREGGRERANDGDWIAA
jgi:hypothetical protein